jgi:hypothetical protein
MACTLGTAQTVLLNHLCPQRIQAVDFKNGRYCFFVFNINASLSFQAIFSPGTSRKNLRAIYFFFLQFKTKTMGTPTSGPWQALTVTSGALLLLLLALGFFAAACPGAEGFSTVEEAAPSITRLIPASGPLMSQDNIRALGHNLLHTSSYLIYWAGAYALAQIN